MIRKLLTVLTTVGLLVGSATYGAQITIDDGRYILTYMVEGENLRITVTSNTTGYIGFGISPNGLMAGADMVIAGYDNTTRAGYIGDYYSIGHFLPNLDINQNVELVSASETENSTTVEFLRPLNNTDDPWLEDLAVENRNQFIIWSLGANDSLLYHLRGMGTIELNLFDD